MAGLLPSFLSSAQLEIRIGSTVLAYAQNLSWTDDFTNTPVGGIGSYSYGSLEPVSYIGRGSMTVTHYSSAVLNKLKNLTGALPANLAGVTTQTNRDGNSLLVKEFFSPTQLLISRTFDLNVYERSLVNNGGTLQNATSRLLYTLKDCRMNNFSITFTPATLINQTVSFICMSVINHTSEDSFKYVKP